MFQLALRVAAEHRRFTLLVKMSDHIQGADCHYCLRSRKMDFFWHILFYITGVQLLHAAIQSTIIRTNLMVTSSIPPARVRLMAAMEDVQPSCGSPISVPYVSCKTGTARCREVCKGTGTPGYQWSR